MPVVRLVNCIDGIRNENPLMSEEIVRPLVNLDRNKLQTFGILLSVGQVVCPSIYRPQAQAVGLQIRQRADLTMFVRIVGTTKKMNQCNARIIVTVHFFTISVNTTGQKLVRLCGDNRHSKTLMQRKTSLCTTGDETLRNISTNFSWIVGSWVRKWFFSPVKMT